MTPFVGGIYMGIEDTHLWKDYYDGCEEEGWQDADPFDKDNQDPFDTYFDEGDIYGDDFEEENYDPDFFGEGDSDDPEDEHPPVASHKSRNIYIPIIDNHQRVQHYCPKCHCNAVIAQKFITQPPKLDSSPVVHLFYFIIASLFTLVALRSAFDIIIGADLIGNMIIICVNGIIAYLSGRAYKYNKKQHEESCKIYEQKQEMWSQGFRCTKCGNDFKV